MHKYIHPRSTIGTLHFRKSGCVLSLMTSIQQHNSTSIFFLNSIIWGIEFQTTRNLLNGIFFWCLPPTALEWPKPGKKDWIPLVENCLSGYSITLQPAVRDLYAFRIPCIDVRLLGIWKRIRQQSNLYRKFFCFDIGVVFGYHLMLLRLDDTKVFYPF